MSGQGEGRSRTLELSRGAIEYLWYGPEPETAPTLIFLHEGLGSAGMWRDFPARLAQATGWGAFAYSRYGYGGSAPCDLPRPLSYMHDEAIHVLPEIVEAMGMRDHVLVGHSDGGSIALIHAGSAERPGLMGLILEAAHVFVEDVSIRSIVMAREAYETGRLREGLMRYHGENTDNAFRGWNGAWLDPAFRDWNIAEYLPRVNVPVLVMQGEDDEYGTVAQVDSLLGGLSRARASLVAECGHAPHKDQPEKVLSLMREFIAGL